MQCSDVVLAPESPNLELKQQIKILNLSENCIEKISKTQDIYKKSFEKKEDFLLVLEEVRKNYTSIFDEKKLNAIFGIDKKFYNFQNNLKSCGGELIFRYYHKIDKTKLMSANFCKKDKLCPACAVRRAYKQQQKFLDILKAQNSLLSNDWYYIVLPVKHSREESIEAIFERIQRVKKAISKSIRNGKLGKTNNFFSKFKGGMYAIEVTKTRNGWNFHINLLMNCDKNLIISTNEYRQNRELEEFLRTRADDSYIHDIQKLDFEDEDKIKSALVEILKYSLKFASLSHLDLIRIYMQTYRKRLFGTFGNLWGCNLEDVDLDDNIDLDDSFFELIFHRYMTEYEIFNVSKTSTSS